MPPGGIPGLPGGPDDTPTSPTPEPGVPTAMTGEPVKFKIVTDREIDPETILRPLARVPGVSQPEVDAAEGTLTFQYTGEIADLPNLERALSSSRMRVFLINPAHVVLTLQPRERGADPIALRNLFYSSLGVRLCSVEGRTAEVYTNIEEVCVCRLTATARENGFEASPQSHVDVTVRLSGDGDLARFVAAVRGIDTVIRTSEDEAGHAVGVLSAGRLNVRNLRRMAEDAGFAVDGIDGN